MHRSITLLPALAALCYGAALPQSIVTGTSTLTAPSPVWTFVIPCYEAGCVVETVTLYGRDADATSLPSIPTELASNAIGLDKPTETEEFGSSTTQTGTLLPRDPEPQSLGSVTRSETYWPWPWPTVTTTTEIITVTVTELPTSTESSSSTEVTVSRSSTFDKRQSIITVSRTVDESPTPSSTSSSKKSTTSKKQSSTTTSSHTTSKTKLTRQALGSPTRTVNVWPPWIWPQETTVTEVITETYTVYPSTTPVLPPSDISSLVVPRQALGSPTRTVDIWPPWWPSATTITDIITETTTVYASSTTSDSLTIITSSPTLIIPSPIQTSSSDTVTLLTARQDLGIGPVNQSVTIGDQVTQTGTILPRQDLGIGPVGHSVTIGDQTTVTGTILPRQDLIGTPTESVSWNGWGTGAAATTVLVVPEVEEREKRQVLWKPTRSFTFDGSTPSVTATWFV